MGQTSINSYQRISLLKGARFIANSDIDSHQFLIRFEDSFRYARGIILTKTGFPLANFFARIDLFPCRHHVHDTDKGKRSLRAKKFASEKLA